MNGTCNNCLRTEPVTPVFPDWRGRRELLCASCVTYREGLVAQAVGAAVAAATAGRYDALPAETPRYVTGKSLAHYLRAYKSTVARVAEEDGVAAK